MTELQATRTLVKSPPELWAECSDAASLARHLGGFGEIRITRLDPETSVAWEGERARGTVRIEPSGWGTKVILTAVAVGEDPPAVEMAGAHGTPAGVAVEAPEPVEVAEPPREEPPREESQAIDPADPPAPTLPAARRRRFSGWFTFRRRAVQTLDPAADAPPDAKTEEASSVQATPEHETPSEPEGLAELDPSARCRPPAPAPETPSVAAETEAALTAALDSLGQAHHRPYSRA